MCIEWFYIEVGVFFYESFEFCMIFCEIWNLDGILIFYFDDVEVFVGWSEVVCDVFV